MSTPRFDPRYDPGTKAAAKAEKEEAAAAAQMVAAIPEHANSVTRARGLHAAYAQCAALRRMLTALRVNRLLVRWRVAVVYICANEHLSQSARTQHAMEDAVVEVHKRGEVHAQRAALVASQRVYLSAMRPLLMGVPRMGRAWARWQLSCRMIDAARAVLVQTALRRWQAAYAEGLRGALRTKQKELTLQKKLTQKPAQLERELAEMGEELESTKEALDASQKKLLLQQQRAVGAEARAKTLRNEVQIEKKRFSSSSASIGGGGSTSARGAREKQEHDEQLGELKKSLAASIAERHQLDGQLSGQRAKVQTLLEARRRSSAQRLSAILLLRAHQALGPALRRWQAASLERAGDMQLDLGPGGFGADTLAVGSTAGDVRQSRIIGLQRELLDREAQLGQAHHASLQWREERSSLLQDLAEARADATAARAKVADAAFAASAAVEKESRAVIGTREKEIEALKKKLAAADKGWRETSTALQESERMLKAVHVEGEQAKKLAGAARREAEAAYLAKEEITEARDSESAAQAELVAKLEAALAREAEQGVIRKRDRPITMQRELESALKDAETLRSHLADEKKKLAVQQKRTLDAEARMEGMHAELARFRSQSASKLHRALQPSPRGPPSPRAGGGVAGGRGPSPLLGQGGFGPQSPRGGDFGVASPRGGPAASAGVRQQSPARRAPAVPSLPLHHQAEPGERERSRPMRAPPSAPPPQAPRGHAAPRAWGEGDSPVDLE